jgi:hypothetical protein
MPGGGRSRRLDLVEAVVALDALANATIGRASGIQPRLR